MKRIRGYASVPDVLLFEIIPAQYLGGPWPAIGMYSEASVASGIDETLLSITLGDQLRSKFQEIGLENLIAASATETLTWREVLDGTRRS
jgi:hypothetical protein